MPGDSADSDSNNTRTVRRRQFVKAAGIAGSVTALGGCMGGGGGSGADTTTADGTTMGGTTSSSEETITVSWAADPLIRDNEEAIMEGFRQAGLPDNIEFDLIVGAWDTGKRQQQYQQWLSAGRSEPDLLMMDSGWTIPFIARDQTLNLSQELSQSTVDTINEEYFDPAVATATGANGDLHAVPLWVGLPTMQYRKDLVEDAGYDPEGENWATESITWKKFSQVTKDVLSQNSDVDYGYTFQSDVYEGLSCCDFNEFMSSWGGAYFGGNLFGPVGDRPVTVDEEQVLNAIRMVRTFLHGQGDEHSLDGFEGQIAPEAVLQWTEESSRKPFTNGNAIMHRNWPYAININGSEENFGEDLGVMPIPYGVPESEGKYGRGGPVGALGGWHLTVNPNAKNKDAALEVIKATMSDDFHMTGVFSGVGQIPPKTTVLASDAAKEVPVMGRYVDTLNVVGQNAVPRPVTVVWPDESTKIAQEVHASFSQSKSPEKAMSDLKESLEAIEQSV